MGIIKKSAFIFLVSLALGLSAQNKYDTTYFSGKEFVKHVVKGGESLKSIAALHDVTTLDIRLANELDRRLFYNQLLYIPIYLNDRAEESIPVRKLILDADPDDPIINIALLMPYYLIRNDTMFNSDTLDFSNRYCNQSESALSFHIGVELAIDSLRRVGKKIVLHTFDTNQDSLNVKRLVYSSQLDKMDIIIGPMYSSLFQILCRKYGQDQSKILISPLSRDNKSIMQFSSVYQIALTYKVQAEILIEYLSRKKLGERIIILNDNRTEGTAAYLRYKFREYNKTVESFQITNTKVDSIRRYFVEAQNVLLLSKDKAFLSTMLGSIGSIDSISTIFSFESITSYDNLDVTNLMELDVHIPNSRSINLFSDYDLSFLSLFEKEYFTNAQKYSKQGYDIIMHFCGRKDVYDFKKSKSGYNENISAPIYHYSDYRLIPVN